MSNVPVSKYGKDHWSMLAYVETCCVDGRNGVGILNNTRVRCNGATHPLHDANSHSSSWKPEYSTRLFGFFDFPDRGDTAKAVAAGLQVLGHDDWDCLNDLEAAGYIEVISESNGHVRMTKEGSRVNGLLREHKAGGGMYANFVLNKTLEAA